MSRFVGGNPGAFLDMLASPVAEGTSAIGDDGYNVIYGSTPARPRLFHSYADHPRIFIQMRPGLSTSAAGRYQLLAHWFDDYKRLLKLPDFSPASQDKIAIQQITERHAMPDILAGRLAAAVAKCANIWASLPGNNYGQRAAKLSQLAAAYTAAGGTLSPETDLIV